MNDRINTMTKLNDRFKLNPLPLALVLLGLTVPGTIRSASAETGAAPEPMSDAIRFRDVFLGAISPAYTPDQRNQLIYLPSAKLYEAPAATTPENFFQKLEQNTSTLTAQQLMDLGAASPAHPWTPDAVDQKLREAGPHLMDRVTFVVIPGVFSELIENNPFAAVLNLPNSLLRDQWRKSLAESSAAGNDTSDLSFDLKKATDVATPLDQLAAFSSIDANGESLANLVLMKAPRLSLESVGPLDTAADKIERRLTKIFQILGETPRNLVIIGYSRGTPVALELLSHAEDAAGLAKAPWLSNVKAMIALGGVNYGTDAADEAFNLRHRATPPTEAKLMAAIQGMVNSMKEIPAGVSVVERARQVVANSVAIGKATATFLAMGKAIKTLQPPASAGNPPPNPQDILHVAFQVAFQEFQLQKFGSEYNLNVRRFRRILTDAVEAVHELTSGARLDWWRHHTIPTSDIRYYSISGVMYNPPSADNVSFNPKDPDDVTLAFQFAQFAKLNGNQLNDSQMDTIRVRFWPEIAQLLNPAQSPFRASFLGVVGTHHWGLALDGVAMPPSRKDLFNPFPRASLLKAFGATVVQDRQ